MTFPPFAGENFLVHHPPSYEEEWAGILRTMVVTAILLLGVLPSLVKSKSNRPSSPPSAVTEDSRTSTVSRLTAGNGKVRVVTRTIIKGQDRGKTVTTTTNGITKSNTSTSKAQGLDTRSIQKKTNQKKTKSKRVDSTSTSSRTNDKSEENANGNEKEKENKSTKDLPGYVLSLINVLFILALFLLVAHSPNNTTTARQVYVAPLLRPEECQTIIQMAENAALRNAQKTKDDLALHTISSLGTEDQETEGAEEREAKIKKYEKILEWPAGWKKDRHHSYPTTDLNVVVDFDSEDKSAIKRILDARLSPLLERVYGVSRDGVRANDMFVVRYDGEGQQSLSRHTDSSHISFNVLLNDEFEGGGTRFHNRVEETYQDAKPRPGQVILNNAMVTHEGLPTTKGTRYIFVGFMNIDQIDPWTRARKNSSLFSTFLSFPWLTVTLKEALMVRKSSIEDGTNRNSHPVLSKNYYVNGILTQLVQRFARWGDVFAPHGIVTLVNDEHADDYLDALDGFQEANKERLLKSRWYTGQQIYVHIDGSFRSNWAERTRNEDKFKEDL
jgi:hypothetical protein